MSPTPPSPAARDRNRLETLYELNDMLKQAEADGLDITVILPRVVQVAALELGAYTGSIVVINPNQEVEHAWVIGGVGDPRTVADRRAFFNDVVTHGLAGLAIREQIPILVHNTLTDPRWLRRPGHPTSLEVWSAVCVPLLVRQRATGALTFTRQGEAQFGEDDLQLLVAIASQAASTIENARLYNETERQLQVSQLLNTASTVINASLDLDVIMHSLLAQINGLLKAEALSIALVDHATQELVYEVAEGAGSQKIVGLRLPMDMGISGWVLQNRQPARTNDAQADPRFVNYGDRRTGYTTRALLCAPLIAKEEVLGTIQVINPAAGLFTEQDEAVLVNLANLASSAIANATQFRRTQAAEARYLQLFEDSIDPIFLTDLDGAIVEANRRACAFVEYTAAELRRQPIDRLHDTPLFGTWQAEKPDEPATAIQMLNRHVVTRSGATIPVEIYVKRTRAFDVDMLQWIYHDITKQVELEQMRKDLTAMLFHDLQDPLSNIISSLELLGLELPPDRDGIVATMLEVATRSSQRLRHLVRSLLDINQFEEGRPLREQAFVAIPTLTHYVIETVQAALQRRHVSMVINLPPDLPAVYANEDMLQRVLINLVDNALKFSQAGQSITIGATLDEPGFVRLSVSDQGPGVPEKYREAIFRKFYRTPDNTSGGLGLGLAFCRLAVQAHGGRIWVTDAPGGGACFCLTLPTQVKPA